MMRNKTPASMQKTYDECYLICSTAVYFEGQGNEEEALRQWRSALDRIYYHNAYQVAPAYRPKSETEKALQDSLREMELQCKERVDLLEALKKSRKESSQDSLELPSDSSGRGSGKRPSSRTNTNNNSDGEHKSGYIGGGTIPVVSYPSIARPGPRLPERPAVQQRQNSTSLYRPSGTFTTETVGASSSQVRSRSPVPSTLTSRTPSPEKKSGRLRTTLRPHGGDKGKKASRSKEPPAKKAPVASSKAAGLAWDSISKQTIRGASSSSTLPTYAAAASLNASKRNSMEQARRASEDLTSAGTDKLTNQRVPSPPLSSVLAKNNGLTAKGLPKGVTNQEARLDSRGGDFGATSFNSKYLSHLSDHERPPPVPRHGESSTTSRPPVYTRPSHDFMTYRSEYPTPQPIPQSIIESAINKPRIAESSNDLSSAARIRSKPPAPPVPPTRRTQTNSSIPHVDRTRGIGSAALSSDETTSDKESLPTVKKTPRKKKAPEPILADSSHTPPSSDRESPIDGSLDSKNWEDRVAFIKKHLPKGVDEAAAKQIFNEIVVQGDEVHWEDVAGLEIAKNALKEAVVYPFLRPDLFMGLREPARGMLLFGPPGTGKTMLARAVATESKSTFFAISASSLTSKWLGESEKLVRALFQLAKALAPSIIFVDEIDSLLSSRGGSSEHESTRRIKTEFLIQWSDLQRAAAGKEQTDKEKKEGDASRVLVLAATNLPWAIDEAARRRFVRRQYIPLPEAHVRGEQLKTLMGHQKHSLTNADLKALIEMTDGFSGSDITALAKDAAMGPLRSLGEALLSMSMEDIRPINMDDFRASLVNIRPSVSKAGLKEFEDWAREFGERGG